MKMKGLLDALEGVDASRRVGWAKYYSSQEEVETLRAALQQLCDAVVFNPRIHSEDDILKLVQVCRGL